MKKFTSTDLGGAPITKHDLRIVFNYDIWLAIEAMMARFNTDTQGVVVSGCVTTANGGNFDMTAGIVYLNGEFMAISAYTNQSFTKYIAPATPINDTRTFADTTSHIVAVDKRAELAGSIPGAGQYITISSLTDLDDRRWRPALLQDVAVVQNEVDTQNPDGLVLKTVQLTGCNMDTTSQFNIPHGLTSGQAQTIKIVSITVNTSGGFPRLLCGYDGTLNDGSVSGGQSNANAVNIVVDRTAGGAYDSPIFNNATLEATFFYVP